MTYVVEGQLKGVMEKANKDKGLKQIVKVSLNEKTLELNVVEQRAVTAEKAWELAKQKAEDLQGTLDEAEIKLARAISLISARDKELVDLKDTLNSYEQVYYNIGFKDVENSARPVIFQARKFGFVKGWMAAMNAIGLPYTSPFRSANQIPLPENPQN